MAEREPVLVCTAWPYANGSLHVGHLAGVYVPADVFARYQRLRGNDVLMVSGTDAHGTPVTVRAEQEGVTPAESPTRYHDEFLDLLARPGHQLRPVHRRPPPTTTARSSRTSS